MLHDQFCQVARATFSETQVCSGSNTNKGAMLFCTGQMGWHAQRESTWIPCGPTLELPQVLAGALCSPVRAHIAYSGEESLWQQVQTPKMKIKRNKATQLRKTFAADWTLCFACVSFDPSHHSPFLPMVQHLYWYFVAALQQQTCQVLPFSPFCIGISNEDHRPKNARKIKAPILFWLSVSMFLKFVCCCCGWSRILQTWLFTLANFTVP